MSDERAMQTPLVELLDHVPPDARLVIDWPPEQGIGTSFIPVGRLCREAAAALRASSPAPPTWQAEARADDLLLVPRDVIEAAIAQGALDSYDSAYKGLRKILDAPTGQAEAPVAAQGEAIARIYTENNRTHLVEWQTGVRDLADGDHLLYLGVAVAPPSAPVAPTLSSLRGMAAGALGERSSEEVVESSRSQWAAPAPPSAPAQPLSVDEAGQIMGAINGDLTGFKGWGWLDVIRATERAVWAKCGIIPASGEGERHAR